MDITSLIDPFAVHYDTLAGDVYTLNTSSITLTGGTLTAAQVIDNGLTASLGVYTDASKQLTSVAPTSGTLGYLNRVSGITGTLRPSNIGDNLDLGTGRLSTSSVFTSNIFIGTIGVVKTVNLPLALIGNNDTFNPFLFSSNGTDLTITAAGGANLSITADGGEIDFDNENLVIMGTVRINTNSITALLVEQNGVKDNTFIVDTTNGAVGINIATPASDTFDCRIASAFGDGTNYTATSAAGSITQTGSATASLQGLGIQATRITSSPYAVLATDDELFVDTDGGAITINLPAGVNGKRYRVINSGSSGNDITLNPNGAENLIGANSSITLSDGDVIIIVYETTEGWW